MTWIKINDHLLISKDKITRIHSGTPKAGMHTIYLSDESHHVIDENHWKEISKALQTPNNF